MSNVTVTVNTCQSTVSEQTCSGVAHVHPSVVIQQTDESYATTGYVLGASGVLRVDIDTLFGLTGAYLLLADTGLFYPATNPSGFATGIDVSNLVSKSETGAYSTIFYPLNSNPANYITGNVVRPADTGFYTGIFYPLNSNPAGYITGLVVRPSDTGNFITSSQTGAFYAANNPSGYITGIDTSPFVLKSETGSYLSLFYPISGNPAGYVTGSVVRPSDTGSFINIGQTGQFYAANNPSGFITGVDTSSFVLQSQTGAYTGVFYPLTANPNGYVTGAVIRPSDTGAFYSASNPNGYISSIPADVVRTGDPILFGSKKFELLILDSSGNSSIDTNNNHLYSRGDLSLDWYEKTLYAADGISLLYHDRALIKSGDLPSLSWGDNTLYDVWTHTGIASQSNEVVNYFTLTGYSYPLTSNPNGYVTGSVVRPTDTGGFVNISQTGQFYAASNPSGYITGIDTSNFVTKSETGSYTGAFYPLSSNPAGYVTGDNVVRKTDEYLYDDSTGRSVSWKNRHLYNQDTTIRFVWDAGSLYTKVGTSGVVIELDDQHLVDSFGRHSVAWDSRILSDIDGYGAVFWQNRLLMGSGWSIDTEPTGGNNLATCNYVTGYAYPLNSNPNGYVTGDVIRPADTGLFYPMSNPSGFATGIDASSLVSKSETGIYTGEFYPLNSNPLSYLTGDVVRPADTGAFVTDESSVVRTNTTQTISQPKEFSAGIMDAGATIVLNPNSKELSTSSGAVTVNWNTLTLSRIDGSASVEWSSSALADASSVPSVYWSARTLNDAAENESVNWGNRILLDTGSITSLDYENRVMYSSDSQNSINWQNRTLDISGGTTLNWLNRTFGVGVWTHSFTPSASGHLVNLGYLTGYAYPLNTNPSGYVTGSVVRPSDTGSFITTSQTGDFYPMSNPSGFATGIDASNFVLKSETGSYTGVFYPLNTNPANYVTGSVVRPTDTGVFATTSYVDNLSRVHSISSLTGVVSITGQGSVVTSVSGQSLLISGSASGGISSETKTITLGTDGGLVPLSTGILPHIKIPFGGTLQGVTMTCKPSGSVSFDVLVSADGSGLPATSIINSFGGGAGTGVLPAITSGVEGKSTSFSGWSTSTLNDFDNIALRLASVDNTVCYAALTLYYQT